MSRDRERTTEVIRHHWDRRADAFDEEVGHGLVSEDQRRAWHELLSRLVDRTPSRVLDVGCGTGFLALRFAELGHSVTGVDLSSPMIERAREKAEQEDVYVEFLLGDAVDLDLPDGTFDVVIARHVIWNLPEPERGVAEWLRVLRPGGQLALVEGKWADNDPTRVSPGSRALSRLKDGAARVLSAGGFPTKKLNREYRRVEFDLPFSGGPSEERLVSFLEANSVHEVTVEPLADAALWGGLPDFPRYLAIGTRAGGKQETSR
jgi:SAM-dependent methyltransferase